jgi:hypothetical protein
MISSATLDAAQGVDHTITDARVDGDDIVLQLQDGQEVRFGIDFSPRLLVAGQEELENMTFMRDTVEWPDLDEGTRVGPILKGNVSGECEAHFARYIRCRREGLDYLMQWKLPYPEEGRNRPAFDLARRLGHVPRVPVTKAAE